VVYEHTTYKNQDDIHVTVMALQKLIVIFRCEFLVHSPEPRSIIVCSLFYDVGISKSVEDLLRNVDQSTQVISIRIRARHFAHCSDDLMSGGWSEPVTSVSNVDRGLGVIDSACAAGGRDEKL
jgi:hypothetical protein